MLLPHRKLVRDWKYNVKGFGRVCRYLVDEQPPKRLSAKTILVCSPDHENTKVSCYRETSLSLSGLTIHAWYDVRTSW